MLNYNDLEDAALLSLIAGDNKPAFDELYGRHWRSLYKIAFNRLQEEESAKDLVQDVFLSLWRVRKTASIQSLAPYLHTAMRHKIYNLLSRGKAGAHFVEPFENMAESCLTADGGFRERELKGLITSWMDGLPEKRREIFRMHFLEGLSTKEISEQLQISQKTVQNQVLLAMDNLRSKLGGYMTAVLIACFYLK